MQPFSARVLLAAVARPLLWVAGFSCFLNISFLAAPLYMMQVYDRVMHSQSVPTLLYLTIAVAMAYAALATLDGVRGQILAGISDVVEATLAGELLHLATSPVQGGRTRPGPAHIGRDLDTVRQFAAGSSVLAFIDLPFAPLYLAVLFSLHWVLGAFALGACLVLLGLTIAVERAARAPMAQAAAVAGRAYQFGDSIARHADCASTMGLGGTLTDHWRGLRADMLAAQNEASRRAVILGAIAKFARLFTQSAILGVGAYLAIHHDISGGAVFAGSLLLGRCLAPVEAVIGSWRATLSARTALDRICQLAGKPADSAIILPAPLGELAAEHASWTPPGTERQAVIDITLRIEPGAVLAVVGPNAAGKSTLGRLLSGAIRPDSGTLRLDGSAYPSWDPSQLGRAIGYLPQEVALFPGTIRDNIARFGAAEDKDVIAAAQAALAHDMILRLPQGYQTRVEEGVGCLSGGQKQRVALARALLWDPPVLILDEPNASLDAEGEAALFRCVIAARERRRTVILITHSTALVRIADHVATMVGGRIMRIQQARDFLTRPAAAAAAAAAAE
jgi:PrtD family type I secretion system ABC transporter